MQSMSEISTDRELRRFYFRWERALGDLWPGPGWRILAALSGGCDSVVLAWLLRESARRGLGTVVLGHVNHQLRPEAEREEAFVRKLADAWGLAIHIEHVKPAELAREKGWSIEQAARVLRSQALTSICRATGCDAIALGHQMDDQAETLLLRILRGTGPRGLGVMAPRIDLRGADIHHSEAGTVVQLRPLLGFRRDELRAMGARAGLEWVEDPSNEDTGFLRNRIRLELIPELTRTYNPRLVESLTELARWQRLESEPVAQLAASVRERATRRGAKKTQDKNGSRMVGLDAVDLAAQPEAVASRVLWLAYQELVGSEGVLGSRHTAELLRLLRKGSVGPRKLSVAGPSEVHLPGRVRARLSGTSIIFELHDPRPKEPSVREVPLVLPCDPEGGPEPGTGTASVRIPLGSLLLEVERAHAPPPDLVNPDLAAFDLEALDPPLLARTWRAGDSLVPFGMTGRKKVSDLLNEQKIPRNQRRDIHVVEDQRGILWVIGHRRSNRAPITAETHRLLVLRVRR
jgi:tRNA(Ile)-lysidine synthase